LGIQRSCDTTDEIGRKDVKPGNDSSDHEVEAKERSADSIIQPPHTTEVIMQDATSKAEPRGNTKFEDNGAEDKMVGVPGSPSKVSQSIEVKYGCFPPSEVFNLPDRILHELGYEEEFISWLREKGLMFARDGRYSFPFDIVTLADSTDLNAAKAKVAEMEKFNEYLRKRGCFFFFRESDTKGCNKLWNGSDVFAFNDKFFLPIVSSYEYHDELTRKWKKLEDPQSTRASSPIPRTTLLFLSRQPSLALEKMQTTSPLSMSARKSQRHFGEYGELTHGRGPHIC
jgi:hypothetical protein